MSISWASASRRTSKRQLTKTLYCPKKTNLFLQKCCTVPKNPKKQSFPVFKELPTTGLPKDWFFFGQYSTFVRKLTKTLYCPKRTNLFLQKCCTVSKKQKKQLFPVFKELPATGLPKDWFFFGTVQHFCKKRLVFLGPYTTFARK